MTGHVTLSVRELDRLDVMVRIAERRLTQRYAAELLAVSERQVRRLYQGYKRDGAGRWISSARNTRTSPTLAHEKLTELHGLELSVETLRVWMMEDGIWQSRSKRARRSYPLRERRPCLGGAL